MKRDLISLQDYSTDEILALLDSAGELKPHRGKRLDSLNGKSIGLIFQKPSNRTRVSFEVGIWELGGNCIYLGPEEINLGKRESAADVAKTLSRYLHGLVARTHSHQDIIELSKQATVPVINGLSDLYHPCQALADLLTIKEKFRSLKGLTLAYVGDGNNVCHSLLIACTKVGMNMRVACPQGYNPTDYIVEMARTYGKETGAKITLMHQPKEAVKGAQVIYADVWVSMGQESESQERLKRFQGFQINRALTNEAASDHIFMHCLPAHRGEEVAADVIDGPHSAVFDQAENRLHVQKAILKFLIPKNSK